MDSTVAPPPSTLTLDDQNSAQNPRIRLKAKSKFSLPNLRKPKSLDLKTRQRTASSAPRPSYGNDENAQNIITLDAPQAEDGDRPGDQYEWAIVYENQRGLTFFSIPYYSSLSLLPNDPAPFTIPVIVNNQHRQIPVKLSEYPLPDGNWKWVSKCWMIDMRSSNGEVQHDGFEYNWIFRTHRWRAETGKFNAGGWVRRRRWIRLMMRPGYNPHSQTPIDGSSQSSNIDSPLISTPSPSILDEALDIWATEDVESNWNKFRAIMKYVGRDGRKLEVWKLWLSKDPDQLSQKSVEFDFGRQGRPWLDGDGETMLSPSMSDVESTFEDYLRRLRAPPSDYLIPFLRAHSRAILQMFIYPDSRARLLEMFASRGLLKDLNVEIGEADVDFWSYRKQLKALIESRATDNGRDAHAMTPQKWASKKPVQVALRAYLLSLSLSLGPSLIPVVTSYIRGSKAKRNKAGGLLQLLLHELGVNGFAFAVAVSFGGSIALNELFADNAKQEDTTKARDTPSSSNLTSYISNFIKKLSPTQRTFLATFLSTSLGASLLRPRSRHHSSQPNHTSEPSSRPAKLPPTLDLTLLLFTRACDVLLQSVLRDVGKSEDGASDKQNGEMNRLKRLRSITSKVDAFLFWASSARIMWCWFYKPQRLPRSYVKWIATLGNVDERVMEALRQLRTGSWSYINGSPQYSDLLQGFAQNLGYSASWGNPSALPAYGQSSVNVWKTLGVTNRHGLGGLPCELVHGGIGKSMGLESSCTANWVIRGAVAFLEAAAIYLPVHFAPVILTRPRTLLDPRVVLPTLLGAGRSATFLASFVALYWASVCFTRTLVLARALPFISHDFWDGPYGCIMAGSLVCGSSIWIENGKRRGEMAFYVLPRAIRTILPVMWMKSNTRKTKLIERLALLLSFSTILSAALHRPEALRGLLRRVISFVLGSTKRKGVNGEISLHGPSSVDIAQTAENSKRLDEDAP